MEEPHPLVAGRPKANFYNYIGDFFSTVKAFIGTNYLALPFAFSQSGLAVGVVGVLFIATLTDHCCHLLIKSKYLLIDRIMEEYQGRGLNARMLTEKREHLERTASYGDLGSMVLGNWARILIDFAVAFTQYLTCVCYFVFIGNAIFKLFPIEMIYFPLSNSTHENEVQFGLHLSEGKSIYVGMDPRDRLKQGIPILAISNLKNYTNSDSCQVPEITFDTDRKYQDNSFTYSNYEPSEFGINVTTAAPNQTTLAPNKTTTPAPTPEIYHKVIAPDMRLLVMIPLPFFLLTSLIRRMRLLAPMTVIASIALFAGAISVFAYIIMGFSMDDNISYYKIGTLPLFVGQLISSYEGIGCILPIENSMEGNRHVFPKFLHASVYLVGVILIAFGSFGYARYGDNVEQIIIKSLPQGSLISDCVDITLIVSVLFTYPLQCYPVIEIMEYYLFNCGPLCRRRDVLLVDEEASINNDRGGLLSSDELLESAEGSEKIAAPRELPGWIRNIMRLLLTLSIMAFGVLLWDVYAFISAFSGAVGCSLLAYILPCVIHLKLGGHGGKVLILIKDLLIIFLAIIASVLTITIICLDLAHPNVSGSGGNDTYASLSM